VTFVRLALDEMDATQILIAKAAVAVVVVWIVARTLFSSETKEAKAPERVAVKAPQAVAREPVKAAVPAPVAQAAPAPKAAPKTAPTAVVPVVVEAPVAPKPAKAKKEKKPKAAPPAKVAPAPVVSSYDESDSDDEDAKPVATSSSSKPKARDNSDQASFGTSSGVEAFDGDWSVVEKTSNKKAAQKPAAKAVSPKGGDASPKMATPAYALAAPEIVTKASQHANKHAVADQQQHKKEVEAAMPVAIAPEKIIKSTVIDSKKVGALVGAKGVTLKAIQDATECDIKIHKPKDGEEQTETVSVTVTGAAEKNVSLAVRSINEMNTKGYCMLLKGENFSEGSIMLLPSSLGEIVGKGGSTLRAIQDAFEVRISTPQNVDRSSVVPIKVGVGTCPCVCVGVCVCVT
jgi:predicted RNA-binding protein Jag